MQTAAKRSKAEFWVKDPEPKWKMRGPDSPLRVLGLQRLWLFFFIFFIGLWLCNICAMDWTEQNGSKNLSYGRESGIQELIEELLLCCWFNKCLEMGRPVDQSVGLCSWTESVLYGGVLVLMDGIAVWCWWIGIRLLLLGAGKQSSRLRLK